MSGSNRLQEKISLEQIEGETEKGALELDRRHGGFSGQRATSYLL